MGDPTKQEGAPPKAAPSHQIAELGGNSEPQNTAPKEKRKSWRDRLPVHPAAGLFPLLNPEELKELAADIKANGLRHGVDLLYRDGKYALIDGRNRLDALQLLGRTDLFETNGTVIAQKYCGKILIDGDAPVDVAAHVASLNVKRRHLTNDQKRDLIVDLLKQDPAKSNRAIAAIAKRDHKTVAAVRKQEEATGEIPQLKATKGKDGKVRPAKPEPKPAAGIPIVPPAPRLSPTPEHALYTNARAHMASAFVNLIDERWPGIDGHTVIDALLDAQRVVRERLGAKP